MRKINPKFQFGDLVYVTNRVRFTYLDEGTKVFRVTQKQPVHQRGIITGAKIRYTGQVHRGGNYGPDDYDPNYLGEVVSVFVYEVRFGFINKPIEVLEEDLIKAGEDPNFIFPFFQANQPEWDERSRQSLREDMKSWPRDSRGRWLK